MVETVACNVLKSCHPPRTALHLACACGHLGVATLLTERKCKLNLRDDEKRTPLMKVYVVASYVNTRRISSLRTEMNLSQ